jgi:hypothetical protein
MGARVWKCMKNNRHFSTMQCKFRCYAVSSEMEEDVIYNTLKGYGALNAKMNSIFGI